VRFSVPRVRIPSSLHAKNTRKGVFDMACGEEGIRREREKESWRGFGAQLPGARVGARENPFLTASKNPLTGILCYNLGVKLISFLEKNKIKSLENNYLADYHFSLWDFVSFKSGAFQY